ncbi:UPF0481 protein [Panicum miliaceum]|uniref:UPF0481 protein n=1 Tax=Panicum miliaceum TaxID=4540 RepID=A0A3L6TFY2_PANMI|nr:UPF0481 protein [Panicum miliaceum]
MERTELAEEKGMERSVPMRAEDGSSSSMQMVAEAKMLEAEPEEKVVEGFALAEKQQGTIKGKESMGVDERDEAEQDSSSRVVEKQLMLEEAKMLARALQTIVELWAEREKGGSSSSSSSNLLEKLPKLEDPGPSRKMEHLMKGKESMGVDKEHDSSSRVVGMSMTKAEAYRPQVVSLGPFHHGEQSLQPMEEQKRRLMRRMVLRSKKPHSMFVDAIAKVADKLQGAYYGLDDEKWRGKNKARFVDVMVTDGGFLLEFMTTVTRTGVLQAGYAPYDPIFSERSLLSLWPRIRSDMILVENQVPLPALQTLEAVRSGTSPINAGQKKIRGIKYMKVPPSNAYIDELVTNFVCPSPEEIRNQELGLHTLEMFHRNFCSEPLKHQDEFREEGVHFKRRLLVFFEKFKRRLLHTLEMLLRKFCGGHSQDELGQSETTMLSAEELREAGVQFKRSKTRSVQDIDFKNGVLSMPLVEIDDSSERTFLNLMAFERLHCTAGSVGTAYMIFMDNIIDSERDVALLRSKKVLKNFLGSDKAAADLFNTLGKGATLKPGSKVGHVQWLVAKHCERPWPKLQASFKHTYVRNPWVFFSALAAITLLALTILQTVYTVMPYYTQN